MRLKTKYADIEDPLYVWGRFKDGTVRLTIRGREVDNLLHPSCYCEGIFGPIMTKQIQDRGLVVIKDYSDNEGVAKALAEAGIVRILEKCKIGFGDGFICEVK